jgi:hypothetical protein
MTTKEWILWIIVISTIILAVTSIVGVVIQYIAIKNLNQQQVIIKQEYDEVKAKIGIFETIELGCLNSSSEICTSFNLHKEGDYLAIS